MAATFIDKVFKTAVDKINKALHNVELPKVNTEVAVDNHTMWSLAALVGVALFGLYAIFSPSKRRYYR